MRAQGKVITVQPEEYLMPLDQSKEYLSSLPSHRRPVNLQVEMRAAFLNVSIVKEGWNEYRLEDGTLLWMRQITKRVNMSRASDGGLEDAADNSDPIVMTICPLELMGAPSTGDRGGGDLRGSIVNENMKFTRLMETRNEYLLPTGDRIEPGPPAAQGIEDEQVQRVRRTRLHLRYQVNRPTPPSRAVKKTRRAEPSPGLRPPR